MKSAVEFHDSECLAIELDTSGNCVVMLDAYVHRSDAEPALSPGDGGIQRVRISVASAIRSGDIIGTLPSTIYHGSLTIGNSGLDLVPLPFRSDETCDLRFEFREDGRIIRIAGKSVSVLADGEFRFVENVDFSKEP
jgi:hypothetical protein